MKETIKKIQKKSNAIKIRFQSGRSLLVRARPGVKCSFERFSGNHKELNRKPFESLKIQTDCSSAMSNDCTITAGYNHVLINGETSNPLLAVFKVETTELEFAQMHLMIEIIES